MSNLRDVLNELVVASEALVPDVGTGYEVAGQTMDITMQQQRVRAWRKAVMAARLALREHDAGLKWTVACEQCGKWSESGFVGREEAVLAGHEHAAECEDSIDQYRFRVKGIGLPEERHAAAQRQAHGPQPPLSS